VSARLTFVFSIVVIRAAAITSQEDSQLWVGKLTTGCDGCFDPATAEFDPDEGVAYDFPRNDNCEVAFKY
jgi:hypothetical protein